jgi:hypothetical protein
VNVQIAKSKKSFSNGHGRVPQMSATTQRSGANRSGGGPNPFGISAPRDS